MVSRFEAEASLSCLGFFLLLAWIGIPFFLFQQGGLWIAVGVVAAVVCWGGLIFALIGKSLQKFERRNRRY